MIKIDIKLPQYRVVVKSESNGEVSILINGTFEVAYRQVRKYFRKIFKINRRDKKNIREGEKEILDRYEELIHKNKLFMGYELEYYKYKR